MKQRILYLDTTRGFAIFLVVFAHLLAVSFIDWHEVCLYSADQPTSIKQAGFLWQLIYSFHMPLFFMISGYLSCKVGGYCLKEEIVKKVKRLLVPYVCTGAFLIPLYGTFGYWFLFALFELSVIAIVLQFVLDKCNKRNLVVVDILLMFVVYLISRKVLQSHYLQNPLCEPARCLQFYIPFFVGFLLKKHTRLFEHSVNHFTCCFVLSIILFGLQYIDNPTVAYVNFKLSQFCVLGCLGAFASLSFFKSVGVENKCSQLLGFLGKNTLEIYILHVFFYIQIKSMGDYWMQTDVRTCITTQILYGALITSLNIMLSILLSKVIKKSSFLNKILFGC